MEPGNTDVTTRRPARDCAAVRQVLSFVGDKWTVLVVSLLGRQRMRFNEMRRHIDGISQRMLTLTLRNLERDGLVTRTVYPTVPPRVEYELTALGHSLLVPVTALGDWAVDNQGEIQAARERYEGAAPKDEKKTTEPSRAA
jgi:DNA-binding HxlR family transcriptional regulator